MRRKVDRNDNAPQKDLAGVEMGFTFHDGAIDGIWHYKLLLARRMNRFMT
jgi:hypothetical protein